MSAIEPREGCNQQQHDEYGACYNCCDTCNYNRHICHFLWSGSSARFDLR